MFVSAAAWHGIPMTRNWGGETVVTACVVTALAVLVVLHFLGAGTIDPMVTTLSDYIFLPGGYVLMGIAGVALAVACLVLADGLRRAGLPRVSGPAGLLTSAAGAFVLVSVFPTHQLGATPGIFSWLHRIAGGWALVAVPLVLWLVAVRAPAATEWAGIAPALGAVAGGAGVLVTAFLLIHVPIVIGASSQFTLIGGAQRVVYGAVMVTLLATARGTRAAISRTAEPVRAAA